MIKSVKIGTRSSKLALYQSNLLKKIIKFIAKHKNLIVEIKTKGDKIQDRNLDRSIDKGFLLKNQEHLLDDQIDIAFTALKIYPLNIQVM